MKLYYLKGACSLASLISLIEAGQQFEPVEVERGTKKTADGLDYNAVNPKGYVPALVLDDGNVLTENVAVPEALLRLQWRMEQRPAVRMALAREENARPRNRTPAEIDAKVRENPQQHRFERAIHDGIVAAAYYRNDDGKLVFIHTEVPSEFNGQGIATELARGTFELLRQSGRKAILTCPFMVNFANTHPEYSDVVVG
jgi:predicted GNAT family acetyltransferase